MYQYVYKVFLTNKNAGFKSSDRHIGINQAVAERIFQSNGETYPLLSSLSFDDFDIFSDKELDLLLQELHMLIRRETFNETEQAELNKLQGFLQLAVKENGKILFDPFSALNLPQL